MNSQSIKMPSDQLQSPSQGKGGTKDHRVCQVLEFGGEKSPKSHLGDTDQTHHRKGMEAQKVQVGS